MRVVGIDSETELIRPGRLAPPVVCVSTAMGDFSAVWHRSEAKEIVERVLEDDCMIVGHNVAYDFSVFAAEWPELLPKIFEVYGADRVTCSEVREKLIDIARGHYRGFISVDGKLVKINYYLEDVAARRCGVILEKTNGWRLRYGELRDTPISFWPEEAVKYSREDAIAPLKIYERQELEEPKFLVDQFRQARAAFWIQLMACWGLTTDPDGVREFARKTKLRRDEIMSELQRWGLVRFDGTRNTKKVQDRVVQAYFYKSGCETIQEALDRDKIPATPTGKPKTDWDTCELSGDPVLKKYSEFSSLTKTLSTDIPILEKCTDVPLEVNFEVLLETGRTSSSPNVQNLPTEVGVRECFRPRPGWVYAIGDYPQIELRTWAQVCLRALGYSRMAEALNAGVDPHCELGRRMLKPQISYDEFFSSYRANPKGAVYFERQAAKAGNFGFPGGLSAPAYKEYAWSNYGVAIDLELAFDLRKFWFETWNEAPDYFDWVGNQDSKDPVMQLFSRRYRGRCRFTEACNTLFQGLAADLAKSAGFMIARACYAEPESPLYGSRIVNFVHDEFVVETPDGECAHDAAIELGRLMEVGSEPFIPEVPCKVEPILSRCWSKKAKEVRGPDGRLVPWEFAA